MAAPTLRLPANAPGPLYVDGTCIDCDTCRHLAPATFSNDPGKSSVRVQPAAGAELEAALSALIACPVGAIGDEAHRPLDAARTAFPIAIDGPVFELGFNARSSYGATSYLLELPGGNWMIDAPRWSTDVVHAIERHGGLDTIFLTHRDDVADAARYAAHFGARRIIHARDRGAMPDAEVIIEGDGPVAFGNCLVVPTPGHTVGHCVLLHGPYLFSGDHLAWDYECGALTAHRDVCWYDWPAQVRSVARLREYDFGWLLPGHGARVHLAPERMRAEIDALVANAAR